MQADTVFQGANTTIERFVVGPIETNCYVLSSGGQSIAIDVGAQGEEIAQHITQPLNLIVATHGHGDHVGGVQALSLAAAQQDPSTHTLHPVPFALAAPDKAQAMRASKPGNLGIAYDADAPEPARLLSEGDVIEVGSTILRAIEAPGHTPGGIVLLGNGFAFTGDTIFCGAIGRTDFAESNPEDMKRTLEKLKKEISAKTLLLPGHGSATTLEAELASNPYF